MAKKKLTPEQTEQAIALAAQGLPASEISKQIGGSVSVQQIGGTISYARRTGALPPAGTSPTEARPVEQRDRVVTPPSAPASSPEVSMSLPSNVPQAEDQGWQSPGGSPDGFTHPTQIIEFKIERVEPKDGVLEVTGTYPRDEEIGNKYGSGTYRIWKREGTKAPVFRDVTIAATFGDPRYPARRSEPRMVRPGGFPPFRQQGSEDLEDRFRGGFPPRPYTPPARPPEDRHLEMAQRGLSSQEAIAVTAVNKLAEINEKQLDRMEKERDRDREPASTITDFFKEQQAAAERRVNEEARRREDERKRDREEWERREQEREASHRREMDRIKLENDARIAAERETRQTLMDLESKKLELIREEARAREAALKSDLERIREEAKEERDLFRSQMAENEKKTTEQLEEMEDAVKEELQKERDALKREHELKEKHLENEQKLKEDLLRLREEIVKGQQGEDLSKVLTKVVEGFERTAKEVLDLKKIEAVSAEERLAKVGQQGAPAAAPGANVTQLPPHAPKTVEHPAAMQGVKPTNGTHAPSEQPAPESTEAMVIRMGREPKFIEMINKWARQVEVGNDAGIFSNMFMELMRDDGTAEAIQTRKALSYFVDEMSTKNWAAMYDFLQPAIPQNLHAIFESPHAEVFYDQLKMMVVESVRDYWRAYFAAKQAEQEAARQQHQGAQAAAATPAPAPPEPPAEEPKPEVTVDVGAPTP